LTLAARMGAGTTLYSNIWLSGLGLRVFCGNRTLFASHAYGCHGTKACRIRRKFAPRLRPVAARTLPGRLAVAARNADCVDVACAQAFD